MALYDSNPTRLVLQYCNGGTLAELWRTHVSANADVVESDIAFVLLQLVSGLCIIKACGLVHHDVKPSNVLVCLGPNGSVQLKLSDFDGAFFFASTDGESRTRRTEGTPLFKAPECFSEAHECGCASDVWSLGIVALYLAEQGVAPRSREHPYRVASLICNADPPMLSDACQWSSGMVGFIDGCLQKVRFVDTCVCGAQILTLWHWLQVPSARVTVEYMSRTEWLMQAAVNASRTLGELVERAVTQTANGEALKEKIFRDAMAAPVKTMEQELVL